MRSIAIIFLSSLMLLSGQLAEAQSKRSMVDPLFGLRYDPQQVHFEAAPASITQFCPSVMNDRL